MDDRLGHVVAVEGGVVHQAGVLADPRDELERERNPSLRHFLPDPSLFADMDRAAERIAEMLAEKEFNQVIVKYRGAGGNRSHSAPGATSAIRALTRAGVSITRIEDVTPVATDGTKSKGGRRGRRV